MSETLAFGDLLTLFTFYWSVLRDARSSPAQASDLAQLRSIIRKRSQLRPQLTAKLLELVASAESSRDVLHLVATHTAQHGIHGYQVALAARTFDEVQAANSSLHRIVQTIHEALQGVSGGRRDGLAALVLSQRTHPEFRRAFGVLPMDELWVDPVVSTRDIAVPAMNGSSQEAVSSVCLIAPYGHGKSTWLRLVAASSLPAIELVGDSVSADALPIYVSAQDLARSKARTIWAAIEDAVEEMHGIRLNGAIHADSDNLTWVIMVDGFDEIVDLDAAVDLFERCYRSAAGLRRGSAVVLAGRDRFFELPEVRRLVDAYPRRVVRISGFEVPQQAAWIEKWNTLIAGSSAVNILREQDMLGADGQRMPIYSIPLVLQLRGIANAPGFAPKCASEVYEKIIDWTVEGKSLVPAELRTVVAGVSDRVSGLPRSKLSSHVRRRLLQEVAFVAMRNGNRFAPLGDVQRCFGDKGFMRAVRGVAGAQRGSLRAQQAKFIDLVREVGIAHFFESGEGGFKFVHQSFVEYLCAERYLADPVSEDVTMTEHFMKSSKEWEQAERFVWEIATRSNRRLPFISKLILDGADSAKLEQCELRTVERVAAILKCGGDRLTARALALRHHLDSIAVPGDSQKVIAMCSRLASEGMLIQGLKWHKIPLLDGVLKRVSIIDGEIEMSEGNRFGLTLKDCALKNTSMKDCAFRRLSWERTAMVRGSLKQLRIKRLDLISSEFLDVKLSGLRCDVFGTNTRFKKCDLDDVVLNIKTGANIRFEECRINQCTFSGDVSGLSFLGCHGKANINCPLPDHPVVSSVVTPKSAPKRGKRAVDLFKKYGDVLFADEDEDGRVLDKVWLDPEEEEVLRRLR